ncbi:TadE-like protein [Pseudoduganella lurida]|uniref:TadE-like protein n=1 Tax=Pseudoduganella lurida TaxID=1036180 RepID=A0A562R1V0_9BURK|nr:TadE family protein [Pseudoduganella lurida]TWI63052.1 TadE-like protein [Pseudoduganella lurida]
MCPEPFRYPAARGAVTVELAMTLLVFLGLVFGTLEVARALFLFNTVQEVTRRAARGAAVTDFSSGTAMAALRADALFGSSSGTVARLPLAPEIDTGKLRIEYLSQDAGGAYVPVTAMPACPQANLANCAQDANGASCIRFIRASLCASATGNCTALPYRPMTGLVPGFDAMHVPMAATLVKAEMLGYRPGVNHCLPP